MALAAACAALFLGSSKAIAWLGDVQIERWFEKEGMQKIELRIDEKIDRQNIQRELRLQELIGELRVEVEKLKTITEKS